MATLTDLRDQVLRQEAGAADRFACAVLHPVRNYVGRKAGLPRDDELVQETADWAVVKALRALRTCHAETDAQVMAWLLTIAQHELLDRIKSGYRRAGTRLYRAEFERMLVAHATPGPTPAGQQILLQVLDAELRTLADRERTLLELRLAGETWRAIGEAIGITAGAARQRHRRLLQRLEDGVRETVDALPAHLRDPARAVLED